jgi:hypothetical protein
MLENSTRELPTKDDTSEGTWVNPHNLRLTTETLGFSGAKDIG